MSKLKISFLLTALSAFSATIFAQSQTVQTVNVYTYDSFTSEWGAGPKIKLAFEKAYPQCQVNFTALSDSGTMFNRLRLEGKKTKADVVVGLDNYALEEAEKSGLFEKNNIDLSQLSLPIEWKNQTFLPYDFGQFSFIYDKTKVSNPPKSLKELVERQDLKVIYQDPRTSSVGRGLLIWMNSVYPQNEIENAWKSLAKHTVTVGKGWSDTYGAFLKDEADLVVSYSTSPLYHLVFEQKDQYAATEFAEGGVLQIETAAKVVDRNNACADHFLGFLLQPEVQQHLVTSNVMLSVINGKIEPHFDALKEKQLKTKVLDTRKVNAEQLKNWIAVWQAALTK
ncbi:thiamine ABC transporter substrate binding subunit [Pasteurella canis]|uniref:thiamine ABC transporter substrate binding subunit n=1 Tax=Pasteurella canis TaxID=753 RepID=UPI00066606EC|nr:thiamine ABC transporter substrate binding subunit [Pasteurella canis]UEA17743.1 thiamine ABC transporter substrate binding subunit [Pasteurella canis]